MFGSRSSDCLESLELDPRCRATPIYALNNSARTLLADRLDQLLISPDLDSGLLGDWRGLAEIIGFDYQNICRLERTDKPTKTLLTDWETLTGNPPTIGDLWDHLTTLNRLDVLQDCKQRFEHDAHEHLKTQERLENDMLPVQQDEITSSTTAPTDHYVDGLQHITRDDTENTGDPIVYDAFFSYNESSKESSDFVLLCIKHLEQEHGLRLCIPARDFLIGGAKYDMIAHFIKARCKRMVVLICREYIHSPDCDFRLKFAHSLEPGARKKRIIPVLLEKATNVPDILRYITLCDFTKPDLLDWFWTRLAASIKAPIEKEENELKYFPCHTYSPLQTEKESKKDKKDKSKKSKSKTSLFSSSSSSSSDSASSGFSIISNDSPAEIVEVHETMEADDDQTVRTMSNYFTHFDGFLPSAKPPKKRKTNLFHRFQTFVKRKK